MDYLTGLGLVALGSRTRALSDQLFATADEIYRLAGLELQGRWMPLLRILHDRGPLSVGEIADAIGQTHSAVSQLADRLEAQGLIDVTADPSDKRRRQLKTSANADALLREAKPLWRALDQVLAEHCRAHGIDLLHALGAFERVLSPALASTVVARAAAHGRDSLRIVPFHASLRAHFYRLNEAWLRKYFYLEEIDHRVLSNPESEILERGGSILFAALGEEIVGTCALLPESDGVYELTKMAVDEAQQGLGIGRALLEAAIAEFQRRDGRMLFLETNSKLVPAVRLYESLGFERQPTTKPDSHYARSDVYMVWRAPT